MHCGIYSLLRRTYTLISAFMSILSRLLFKHSPLFPWVALLITVRTFLLSSSHHLIQPFSAPHRKRLLLFFAFAGAGAAMCFLLLPSASPLWPLSALLAAVSNVSFGASVVAMNAYLPALAQSSPEVVKAYEGLQRTSRSPIPREPVESEDASSPLLTSANLSDSETKSGYDKALSAATARISAQGIATGYGAGILLLLLALIPVTYLHGNTFSLRLAIGASGIWWALGTLPAAAWLPSGRKERQSIVEDGEESWGPVQEREWNARKEIADAWKRLGATLRPKEIRKLRHTFTYLAAWFLLSDGNIQS
jgi:MFS transporter, UMF1 family